MGEVRRTLIPQFSLRLILGVISALAVVAFVASTAGHGWAWAAGVSVGLLAIALAFIIFAIGFAIAWFLARLLRAIRTKAPPSSTKTLIGGMFVLLNLLAVVRAALAVSGGTITLPALGPSQANSTGLQLTIDTTWVDSFGYRPVRLTVRSIAGPLAADRILTIRFRPRLGYTQQSNLAVTQTIEIPAGSSEARATMSVPQEGTWGSFELDVFEDRQYLEQLSIGPNAGWTSWSGTDQGDRSVPVILALGNVNRPVNIQVGGNSAEELIVRGEDKPAAQTSTASGGFAQRDSISIGDLPTRWIDYSGVDVVICSWERVQALIEQHPRQWQAIRAWLRNGGNLIVYGAGKKWEKIAELEQAVGLVGPDTKAAGDERDPTKRGWSLPSKNLHTPEVIETPAESTATDVVKIGDAPFVTRPCGLGMVAAAGEDETVDGTGSTLVWLFNTLGPERWRWSGRYGLSLARENNDVWNFLIPGVGLAPVTQFQVFITLFMLAIGPVNYFVLRRWGKLNLMVITVPAGALLVTLGLITTALLADGLGVRVRVRSVTTIDQTSGEAASWARLSYYAGLAPSGGLTFTENTAVLPLEAEPGSAAERQSVREVDWMRSKPADAASPLEQRLTEGWLPARTPTQFITSRIGKMAATLEVKTAEKGQAPQIVNHLGARIKQMVLIGDDGGCFVGDSVAAEGVATLRSAPTQHEASGSIVGLISANQPVLPSGLISSNQERSFFGLGGRYRNAYPHPYSPAYPVQSANSSQAMVSQNSGVLERTIREIVEQFQNDSLPPRSYVAVMESSPGVELGTPSAKEEASFHLVLGKW